MLNRFLLCVVALVSMLFAVSASASPIAVTAGLESLNGRYSLRIAISNETAQPLALYRNALPWVDRPGALMLKAYKATPLLDELPIMGRLHDQLGATTIPSGKSLSEAIPLNPRIEGLEKALAEGAVVVLWIYIPRSPDRDDLGVYSGTVIIPQAK